MCGLRIVLAVHGPRGYVLPHAGAMAYIRSVQ